MENKGATEAEAEAEAEAELTCVRCGYDLRGRALEEPCPECGLAGHRSALKVGRELWDCPPRWVGRVAIGAVVALVVFILWPVVALLSQFILEGANGTGVLWGLLGVQAVGAVLITAREPGGRRTRGGVGAWGVAWGLRVCSVGAAVGVPLSSWYVPDWWSPAWYGWLWTGARGLVVACPALIVLRLRWLTVRVGRPRVAEHAAIAGCGLSAGVGVIQWLGEAWSRWPGYAVFVLGIGTVVVCYFWCVGVTVMVARSLSSAAGEAREAWRAADAARG